MDATDLAAELAKPMAGQLLRSAGLARLAYVAADGTPRVVPIGFLWEDGQVVVFSPPAAAKVRALRARPAVALSIDQDGLPPRALLLRGRARVEVVDGVPEAYVRASLKTQSAKGAEDFAAEVRAMYTSMARITIEIGWARLNDFESSLPKAVEDILSARAG